MESPDPIPIVGTTEGDAFLRALGVHRLAIPIPFLAAGGPINVYAIENLDGSLTLFDAGLGSDEARGALERGFAQLGRRLEDVREVLVSHGHVDHYGAARFLVERSGARVRVHPRDARKVLVGDESEERAATRDYLRRLGVPDAEVAEVERLHAATDAYGPGLEAAEPLEEGMRFRFAHFDADVLHMPGHTPGLVCLWAARERIVFADDHLLARVSPNPLIDLGEGAGPGKFRALESYLASVRRLHALDVEWVLPGHGPPFRGHRQTIETLLGFYDRRQAKILEALAAGPLTAYELVKRVFGRAGMLQLYLMLSEIVGNLEVLETRGALRRVGEVPWRWTAQGG